MTGHSRSVRTVPFLPQGAGPALRRHAIEAAAAALAGVGLVGLAALVTYSSGDPSWNTASPLPPANLVGGAGAWLSDAGLQSFGYATAVPPLALIAWGWRLWARRSSNPAWPAPAGRSSRCATPARCT